MMRAVLVAFGFLAASLQPALSEPIVVRAGEHETFTRLVLALPADTDWRIDAEAGSAKLVLDGFDDGFDLNRTFDVIPRSRLSALLAQSSALELQLTCNCPVNAFLERNGFLVLDISDGPALESQPEVPVVTSQMPASSFSFGELLWRDAQHPVEQEPIGDRIAGALPEAAPEINRAAVEAGLALETQDRLLEAFSDAASRGILDLKDDTLAEVTEEAPDAPPEVFDSSAVEDDLPVSGHRNIRVTNSKDVPTGQDLEDLALSGAVCPDPKLIAIPTWGTDEPLSVQLAASNAALYDELGRIDPRHVVVQTKLYLYFGFGAEARQTLNLIPGLAREHPELVDLAGIMEYGFARNPRSLHRFADCDSDYALWAILSARESPVNQAIDAEAALRALQSLPQHLKFFVGQALSDRLLQRGDVANASIAMRSYERLEENNFEKPTLAEAEVSSLRGDEAQATVVLGEIIAEDTPEAPEAIAALIDRHVADDNPVAADIALLAEAYAFELRLAENGPRMFRAFVLAATKSGQFAKAFDALQDSDPDAKMKGELASYLVEELAGHAEDPEFLKLHFERFTDVESSISDTARVTTAERLFDLGFVDRADALLTTVSATPATDRVRLLKARVHFSTGDYDRSLSELSGLNSLPASELRARNMERLGQNQIAARLFAAANQPERATTSLWLSDGWSDTLDQSTPVFGPLSALANREFPELVPDQTMLARSEDALAESAAARDTLRAALDALKVSE